MDVHFGYFVWDDRKEEENIRKHGVDFSTACRAFLDSGRKIFRDAHHSGAEDRLFCIGKVDGKVLTVRYTLREGKMRLIGAGYWRKGRRYYDEGQE